MFSLIFDLYGATKPWISKGGRKLCSSWFTIARLRLKVFPHGLFAQVQCYWEAEFFFPCFPIASWCICQGFPRVSPAFHYCIPKFTESVQPSLGSCHMGVKVQIFLVLPTWQVFSLTIAISFLCCSDTKTTQACTHVEDWLL